MAGRKRIAAYGRRGQLVRVFSETIGTGTNRRKLVRVQWNEFKGAPLTTESWPFSKESVVTAKGYAEGVAQRLALGMVPAPTDRTIRELADGHVAAEAEAWAPATLRNFRHRWGRFEAFAGKNTPAKLVTEETLDEFRNAMRRAGVATMQRSETVGVVKQVFRWARRRKLIAENPIADYRIKLAKGEKFKEVPEWAPDEVRRQLEQLVRDRAIRSPRLWRLAVALHLAALQAPRQNALRHLDVDDVNLSGKPRRHPTAGITLPPRTVWWNPEFDKQGEERVQPLTRGAVRAIRIAMIWRERIGYEGRWLLPPVQARTLARGVPWSYQALNQALRNLCARCSPPIAWIDGRGLHGYRKYSAGNVANLTGSERAAADWIGDKDIKVVRKHYLKVRAEQQRTVANQVDAPKGEANEQDAIERAERAGRRAGAAVRVSGAVPHGTLSGYNYHRCRCDECRGASLMAQRARRGITPDKYRVGAPAGAEEQQDG